MPANLTPDYMEAERLYKQARTDQERMAALEQMLSTVPKHKGTEKIQSDIKHRMAKLRELSEEKSGKGGGKRGVNLFVPREGAGQVILIGPPNSGKSSILGFFTKAQVEIADYPYTTRQLQPGMMPFGNVQIQLVDTPALSPEMFEPWMTSAIRSSDYLILVVDLMSPGILDDLEFIKNTLRQHRIELNRSAPEKFDDEGNARIKAVILGTHLDLEGAKDNLEALRDIYGKDLDILALSFKTGEGADKFAGEIFQRLEVVRIYTKSPGKPADRSDPVVLRKGSTVDDFARGIHKDLEQNLKYARIWGKNKFEGQRVPRDYVFEDEDICELHG